MVPQEKLESGFIHLGKGLPHMIGVPIGGEKMQLRDIKTAAQRIDILNKLEFVNTISP